jgi:uncharacterized protein YigA (DUF484 family)
VSKALEFKMSKINTNNNETDSDDTALWMDRFVSASSADDVLSALEQLARTVQSNNNNALEVLSDSLVMDQLILLLQTCHVRDLLLELDGQVLALELCTVLAKHERSLHEPSPGRLTEALVDVACSLDGAAVCRVRALELLLVLSTTHARALQSQLLAAPNALFRLGLLLQETENVAVTSQATLTLTALAQQFPAMARNWMFQDAADFVVASFFSNDNTGFTNGPTTVLDGLCLLQALLQHDKSSSELVVQSSIVLPGLTRMLDLRGASAFLRPQPTIQSIPTKLTVPDDLDDLLAVGNTAKTNTTIASQDRVIPKLTKAEETIVSAVLDVLALILAYDSIRAAVWNHHPALCALVWELALMTLPPDQTTPFVCGVPSSTLQQRALHSVASFFNSAQQMDARAGMDRLLFLVCTGGNMCESLPERLQVSQSALHVLRQTLSKETAIELLLQGMAPSMTNGEVPPPTPTVVVILKLVNTVYENLNNKAAPDEAFLNRRRVFLLGATSALTLFLHDEACRGMFLRMTSTTNPTSEQPSLMDQILARLADINHNDDIVCVVLLRFLAHWCYEAPVVVQSMLSSMHGIVLGALFVSKQEQIAALASLLLGLALCELKEDESKCGGWTTASIMEMIAKRGVSKFTMQLEAFKKCKTDMLPWSACSLEWSVWNKWYEAAVLVVRKRVVQELTATGENEEGMSDEDLAPSSTSAKSLQRLVTQQQNEIDLLQTSLREAQSTIVAQGTCKYLYFFFCQSINTLL